MRSTSISRAGVSDVVLDFDWGTSMTFAVQDVRESLDGVFLPDGAERPLILRYDPNLDPILRIGIRSPERLRGLDSAQDREAELIRLRWIAENRIKRELESIEGVAAVQVRGGLEEEIKRPHRPVQAGRAEDRSDGPLAAARAGEHQRLGRLAARGLDRVPRPHAERVRVGGGDRRAPRGDARAEAVMRVKDVADVERTYAKREVVSRISGARGGRDRDLPRGGRQHRRPGRPREGGDLRHRVAATEHTAGMVEREARTAARSTFADLEKTDYLEWRLRR